MSLWRWVPFIRGDDGLTNRQRRQSVRRFERNHGTPSAAEMERLRALLRQRRSDAGDQP